MAAEGGSPDMRTARIPEANRLSEPWLLRARILLIGLLLVGLVVYAVSFERYVTYLQTGFTGAWCLTCDGHSTVRELHIVSNSPADRAGLKERDVLRAVDGVDVAEMSPSPLQFDDLGINGKSGTSVTMTVEHPDGTADDHTITRERGWDELSMLGPRVLGASETASLVLALSVDVLIALGFIAAGVFMIWRRPDDWLVMFTGLALALAGIYDVRAALFLPPTLFSGLYLSLVMALFFSLCFIFPDGKLVPRGGLVVIGLYFTWLLLYGFVVKPIVGTWSGYRLIDLPFWVIGLGVQVYRYRRVSTPQQRQQTKWVIIGLIVGALARFTFLILSSAVPALNIFVSPSILSHVFVSLGDTLSRLLVLAVVFTFIFAMMRYRLWDVDFIINRGVVYTLLTAALTIVFAVGFWGLQALLGLVLRSQQPTLAIIVSTILVIGIFSPTHEGLRTFVDRRFYGIKVNYQPADSPPPLSPVASSLQLKTGLDTYQGLESIGRGGMAEIYKATDPRLKRTVAIKVLSPALARDPEFQKRFEREAHIVATLKHPNIVQMHDYGVANDSTFYMVMEYINGRDLGNVIRDGAPLPLDRVQAIVQDIASALDYAHAQGLVHRDVKPSNVMLEPVTGQHNKGERAVLMDFGIARMVTSQTRLTTSGMVGTLDFMAPEQIQEAAVVDGRADVYSLGVMIYQMVTGKLPFKHENPAATLIAHLMEPAPDPRTIMPGLAPAPAQAIVRAMAKKPGERFATAGAFATALAA